MFHTEICDLLGIEYPILQGAMQGAGGPRLVAAVCEAGGLGVLPTFGGNEATLREDIARTRAFTPRPFAVNITPIGRAFTESRARICIELHVPIVTTGRGDPGLRIVEMLKGAGIIVLPVVPSVKHAIRVEAEGADAIIASGCEAGGHVGTVATLPLVPQVVDAVKVPVIAAGGIADARGFLAAFALGARGVQLGTRLIATPESEAPRGAKERILAAAETDTVVTSLLTGKPVRTLATRALSDYERARLRGDSAERQSELREVFRAQSGGKVESEHTYAAGQVAGMIRDVRPVREIFLEMMQSAAALSARLSASASA
jgi:enoyl-[acyl-carrier protein] reductase II